LRIPLRRRTVSTFIRYDIASDEDKREALRAVADHAGQSPTLNVVPLKHGANPMSELLTYGAQLRSITQGRGLFHLEFDHYSEVPQSVQEKVIAQSKAGKSAAEGA
jgi:translation elongation factor EF-G